MTIEEYARAVAEAVQLQCGLLTGHPVIAVLDTDAIIASVPKPEGCPACKYYHGLPAPDVQAQDTRQDTRPPCNCPRDYAQYLGDDPHNRWCPRSRNPHPEVIQAQIDAAPNGYADRAFTDAEWATRYAEKCRERDVALAARDERAPFCEKHRADEQWRGLTDCLACATEELEARVTEFDSQIDAARAEEREATWFLLYGGTSADGAGPGKYVGRTTDPEVARAHHHEVKNDPYSTGYVEIVTDSTCRRAWSADEIRARSGAKGV